jgi:hypothetical protein
MIMTPEVEFMFLAVIGVEFVWAVFINLTQKRER